MERLALEQLEAWNRDPRRKPLMIWGARQTGKTYLIKDIFAKRYYEENTIYIDCNEDYHFSEFCEAHPNVKEVLEYLELTRRRKIDSHVLLIFDEAQDCLPIVTLMKYFCQDYREIPVIVTGSMVRIKIKRNSQKRGVAEKKGFLFPVGKIDELTLYPMTFQEFIMNQNPMLYQKIRDSFQAKQPLDHAYHMMAMDYVYRYLLVGGMPEAEQVYLETEDMMEVQKTISVLYDNYLADMELYQASPESIVRTRKIFNMLYTMLGRESKNFSASMIEKNKRTRDMESPIDWLLLAGIAYRCPLVKEQISLPLKETNESLFRLYMLDTGMIVWQSRIDPVDFISDSGRNTLSGAFFENYVADELSAANIPLFYWTGKRSAEFEFIMQHGQSIVPIDAKKGKGVLNSWEKFKEHNPSRLAVKVSSNNYGYDKDGQVLTIPFYDFFLFLALMKTKKLDDWLHS